MTETSRTEDLLEKGKKDRFPDRVNPMLATLQDVTFSGPEWLFERKLDGERCLIYIKDGQVIITSRNHKKLTDKYPEIHEQLEKQNYPNLICDGELVTFDGNVTSFSRLQNRMKLDKPSRKQIKETPVELYIFDLIYFQERDLTGLELKDRKQLLKSLLNFNEKIHFCQHRNEDGQSYHQEACSKGWEGIIAKKIHSTYTHSRSRNWLKLKCTASQELIIGGYTDPKGDRIGFGAILVGFYDGYNLRYAGKVGTGYSDDDLERLYSKFEKLGKKSNPFDEEIDEPAVHFIEPELVAEIGFTEWTSDDKLRHPSFLGLRDDKNPEDVVKEKPS